MTVLTDTTPRSTRSEAAGSERLRGVPRRRASGFRALVGVALATAALVVTAVASVAVASPSFGATTAPRVTSAPPTTGLAAATPTITVADSPSSSARAGGTAAPGDRLRVLDPLHPASSLCTTTADDDGSWSCAVTVASGAGQSLTVRDLTQTALPDVQSPTFSALVEPTLSTPSGVAVGAKVSGTAYIGATVFLTVTGTGSSSSTTSVETTTVSSSGAWQVLLPASRVPEGTYSVQATQKSSRIPAIAQSSPSAAVSISVDRTAPKAPVVLHPQAGSTVRSQPFTFDGTGENGDTVTTYIDSNPVCTAVVAKGTWSCSTTGLRIPEGAQTVQAAQRDPAGNYGAASHGATVLFASVPTSAPTPSPTSGAGPSPSASAQPGPSSSGAPPAGGSTGGTGSSSGGPSTGGSGGSSGPGGSGGGTGSGSGSSGGSTLGLGALGSAADASWTAPTGFGHNIPTLGQSVTSWAWLWALVLGLLFVALVIVPLRLVAPSLGGRLAVRARRLTGRNRAIADRDDTPLLPLWASVAASLVGGAVLVVLAFGVDDQPRYLRLVIAVALGLGLVNGLGSILPSVVLARRWGLRLRFRVSPKMLAVAAILCLVTRLAHLDPPLALGVLVVASLVDAEGRALTESTDVRRRGILATTQLSSLALVSFAAWVVHGLVPTGTSFGGEILREALATACLAGLGSLVVLLIPIGRLAGHAAWAWSRSTLIGLGIVGSALAAVVYAGDPDEAFPLLALVVAAVAFAVVALSAWAWVRFVEPALDDAV